MTRITAAAAAALMVFGLAACGDDSDDAASTTTAADATTTTAADGAAASGDSAAFCDALTEFNGAVTSVELDESSSPEDIKAAGAKLAPMFKEITDNAPDDVADQAAELNKTVVALAQGDASQFNSDATYEKYGKFVTASLGDCDFETVEVKAKDYAFEAPDSVEAGDVAFHLTNTSTGEQHEMVLLRKNDGVNLSFDELLKLPQDQAETKTTYAASAMAPPGGDNSALVNLKPGSYAMVCFLPIGGKEGAPPHFTQGMVHEFTVK
jgi:hypothetical protein